jgi:hypothetical protein
MIAAIYARKVYRAERHRRRGEVDRSPDRTRERFLRPHARAGWWTTDHVYVDDGISGAEFVKRPALSG